MRTTIIIALSLLAFSTKAQTVNIFQDTITWTSGRNVNLATGDSFNKSYSFVTYGTAKIEFINGTNVKTFEITATDSYWANLNTNGVITYDVTFRDKAGKIIIQRTDEGLFLTVDMTPSSADGIKTKYYIDQFSAL